MLNPPLESPCPVAIVEVTVLVVVSKIATELNPAAAVATYNLFPSGLTFKPPVNATPMAMVLTTKSVAVLITIRLLFD